MLGPQDLGLLGHAALHNRGELNNQITIIPDIRHARIADQLKQEGSSAAPAWSTDHCHVGGSRDDRCGAAMVFNRPCVGDLHKHTPHPKY